MLAKHYPVSDPGYPRGGDMKNYYYRPQTTKFAKVMFLHMSVILSTRDKAGGGGMVCRHAPQVTWPNTL